MEKIIKVKISLDKKSGFVTAKKEDITDDVFDYLVDATEEAMKQILDVNEDDFANLILENYTNKLPENFKCFKDIGFKVEVIN